MTTPAESVRVGEKWGTPTCSWPVDTGRYYVRLQFHEYWFGPFDSLDDVLRWGRRMDTEQPDWRFDSPAVCMGSGPEHVGDVDALVWVSFPRG